MSDFSAGRIISLAIIWKATIRDAKQIKNGVFELEIEPDSHVDVNPVIRSQEPAMTVISAHAGVSYPVLGFGGQYIGANGGADLEIKLIPTISLAAYCGYNYFWDFQGALNPMEIVTAAANLRYHQRLTRKASFYISTGPEYIWIDNFDWNTQSAMLGLTGQIGLDLTFNRLLSLEIGGRFHTTVDLQNYTFQYRFITGDIGLLFAVF